MIKLDTTCEPHSNLTPNRPEIKRYGGNKVAVPI